MIQIAQWPGWAAFHAAKKVAHDAGQPVPSRQEFAESLPRTTPLLNSFQQAD